MKSFLLSVFQVYKMKKTRFFEVLSSLQNVKTPFLTRSSSLQHEKTFLKRFFQVYNMKNTFLKRFQVYKMENNILKHFSSLPNEKTSF